MASYLGKKISLISKAGIRYEGILYTIDPTDSTVALSKVKSFGTEERPCDRFIPARDEVYEYIIFRGSDISDLHVCGNSLYTDDSAIVKIVSPPQNSMSIHDQGDIHNSIPINTNLDTEQNKASQLSPKSPLPINNASQTIPPNRTNNEINAPTHFNKSSSNNKYTRDYNPDQPTSSFNNRYKQHNTDSYDHYNNVDQEDIENIASKDYQHFVNRDYQHYNNYYSGNTRRGFNRYRGSGGSSSNRNQYHFETSEFGLPLNNRRNNQGNSKLEKEDIKDDFDFESSNALIAEEFANMNMDEKKVLDNNSQITNMLDAQNEEDQLGINRIVDNVTVGECDSANRSYYDKTKSFFDNISSDRQVNQNERWGDRKLNHETFGGDSENASNRRPYNRGGYYQRWSSSNSYNRGGRPYYSNRGNTGFVKRGNFANRGGNNGSDWRSSGQRNPGGRGNFKRGGNYRYGNSNNNNEDIEHNNTSGSNDNYITVVTNKEESRTCEEI